MNTSIQLARLLASEREQDMLRQVESRRRVAAARQPRTASSWGRLLRLLPSHRRVSGDTPVAA